MSYNISQMKNRATFFTLGDPTGPYPNSPREKKEVWSCWCDIDSISLKDYQAAVQTGTEKELTIRIRDSFGEFLPSEKMMVEVDSRWFENMIFDIKQVIPDVKDPEFINLKVGVISQ